MSQSHLHSPAFRKEDLERDPDLPSDNMEPEIPPSSETETEVQDGNPEEGETESLTALHKGKLSIFKRYSKRQWSLFVFFAATDFLVAITWSLQAPFYPAEAEKKGATPTEYGFVFGIFEFVVFLVSPIYGKYIHRLGPKRVFAASIVVTSLSVVSFGLMDKINDRTWFIALSLTCRTVEALGGAGFFLSTFVIIAIEFPTAIATTFASLETFIGLGFIVGPTFGGAFYELGGFPLPFFIIGVCLLLTGITSYLVMPRVDKITEAEAKLQGNHGILDLLKIPSIALASIAVTSTSMSFGFITATLEPHIRMFNLTPFQTGLVFIVNGGVYAITAPISGYICDNIKKPIIMSVIGSFLLFASFLIIGPASFVPLDTILWVTIVGLAIQGLGYSGCFVAGFIVGLRDAMKRGLPDNTSTYALCSGLWQSAISLGAWSGPVISGILFDNFGFRRASLFTLGITGIVGIATLIFVLFDTSSLEEKKDLESQPLLRSSSPKPSTSKAKSGMSYGSTGKEKGKISPWIK